jgi:hypothetical protein
LITELVIRTSLHKKDREIRRAAPAAEYRFLVIISGHRGQEGGREEKSGG